MPTATQPSPQNIHRHEAMATWFEVRIATADADYAAQAAQEAFACIDRLETLLSRYREDSEVRQLGRLAPGEELRLHPDTFACLRQATRGWATCARPPVCPPRPTHRAGVCCSIPKPAS
jgi:thiamine biosynthesis lipoprotein ApbE